VKVTLRHVVVGVVALAVIGVVAGAAAWWPRTGSAVYASGPDSPRLVVAPQSQGYMMAEMHGALGVNAQECVTFDGDVLLAPHGTQVTPDGKHISFPHYAPIRIGASLVGGGGNYPRISDLSGLGWDDDLVDALRRCVGDDPGVGVVQFWLSRD
jgi:hypothetical protein